MEKYKVAGRSQTSPVDQTQRRMVTIKTKPAAVANVDHKKGVYVFCIGGAGDKRAYPPIPLPGNIFGPHGNVADVQVYLDTTTKSLGNLTHYESFYLGYYEIYGEENIQQKVVKSIPDKNRPIIIIGHSLGGWNGAHLSGWLNNAGYDIAMLVTLDPVGEGFLVSTASNIYHLHPKVAARRWINIRAEANDRDFSDAVAKFGEQWIIKAGPHIDVVVDRNHASALSMFKSVIHNGRSAADDVVDLIKRFTK